jgi:hypothetical protein
MPRDTTKAIAAAARSGNINLTNWGLTEVRSDAATLTACGPRALRAHARFGTCIATRRAACVQPQADKANVGSCTPPKP